MKSCDLKTNGCLWNLLADRFNTYKKRGRIHPDAAVNIEVGWPVFLQVISNHSSSNEKKRLCILDFGCGAGEFCGTLLKLGHDVTGLDHSRKMIDLAKAKLGSKVSLVYGNHKAALFDAKNRKKSFDVVTAIHSLEWVQEIELALENLSSVVAPGGLLIFAVFPRMHIRDSLVKEDLFEAFDSFKDPYFGYANFDGVRIPLWVRTPKMYDKILNNLGFKRLMCVEPDYPKKFFTEYKWTGSKYPEMVIMVYKKS